jgi:hypothetical protein
MWRQLGHGSYRDDSNGMDVPYVRLRSPFVPGNLLGGNFWIIIRVLVILNVPNARGIIILHYLLR